MTGRRIAAWLIALVLLMLPAGSVLSQVSILALPTTTPPAWLPGITPFSATSPVNQRVGTASFTGAISGTTLTTSGASGVALAIGQTITFSVNGDVKAGTKITGGSGTSWTVNNSQTIASEAMQAATYTPFTTPGWPAPTSSSPTPGFSYFIAGPIQIDIPAANAPTVTVTGRP